MIGKRRTWPRPCAPFLFSMGLAIAVPATAKSPPCDPPEVARLMALIEDAHGDRALILATIRLRLSTPQLTCWAARTGDKAMLLDLATRYEAGDDIPQDVMRAEALYASAAMPIPGTTFIYSPKVGNSPGRVIPIRTGPDIPGRPEGDYRRGRMHIEGRAAKPSYRRGVKWIARAAKAGYGPAQARLAELGRVRT